MFVDDEQEKGRAECPNASYKARRYTDTSLADKRIPALMHTQLSLSKQFGRFLSISQNIQRIDEYKEEKKEIRKTSSNYQIPLVLTANEDFQAFETA